MKRSQREMRWLSRDYSNEISVSKASRSRCAGHPHMHAHDSGPFWLLVSVTPFGRAHRPHWTQPHSGLWQSELNGVPDSRLLESRDYIFCLHHPSPSSFLASGTQSTFGACLVSATELKTTWAQKTLPNSTQVLKQTVCVRVRAQNEGEWVGSGNSHERCEHAPARGWGAVLSQGCGFLL